MSSNEQRGCRRFRATRDRPRQQKKEQGYDRRYYQYAL
jgi:hypothetical protein